MREGRHGHKGHHGGHKGHSEDCGHPGAHRHMKSAQTFRRGRALGFLEHLKLKRSILLQQLGQAEYEAIKPVISGELKAVDSIIQEFIHSFELHEISAAPKQDPTGEEEDHDGCPSQNH